MVAVGVGVVVEVEVAVGVGVAVAVVVGVGVVVGVVVAVVVAVGVGVVVAVVVSHDDDIIPVRREDPAVCAAKLRGEMDYDSVTPLEWFKYELATLQHDYKINPEAVRIIEVMAERLTSGKEKD